MFYGIFHSYYAVMAAQLILNLGAVCIFRKLLLKLGLGENIAFVATLAYILTFQIQLWNFYLFTESVFTSLVVLLIYSVIDFDRGKKLHYLRLLIILLALSFTRPIGVAFYIPTAVYFFLRAKSESKSYSKIIFTLSVFLSFQLILMLAQKNNFHEFFSTASKEYWVIGAYNTVDDYSGFSNLGAIPKAILLRFFYYFSMMRPYFSSLHNAMQMLFYPVYLLSVFAFVNFRNRKALLLFILLTIAIFSGFSILTHVNYHARYITPILPFFLLSAAFGLRFLGEKLKKSA